MAVKITCVNKAGGNHYDPHTAISDLGWINEQTNESGISSREEIYDWLKNQGGVAYVLDRRGNKAYLYPKENVYGTKFVQTYADKVWTDNLLSLNECSVRR